LCGFTSRDNLVLMIGVSISYWTVGVLLALGVQSVPERSASRSPSSARGEVIVKFKSMSKAGECVSTAAKENDIRNESLVSFSRELSKDLGTPVEATQLTSGGEVVLGVQFAELAANLAALLKARPQVTRSWEIKARESPAPSSTRSDVGVAFAASSREAQVLAQGSAVPHAELKPFLEGLEHDFGSKLRARVDGEKNLVLGIDEEALTLTLVERLKGRADVEYAQPNFVARKFSRDP